MLAIVGAEYVLEHAAARHTRIRQDSSDPANWPAIAATTTWTVQGMRGMEHNPLTGRYWLSADTSVNYMVGTQTATGLITMNHFVASCAV
jgi:2-polyprenyl-6-hydroxyphenyl methylase/3-demethylubiquinone-9 3-methyltransferase